ncbi:response regulator [Derxia lacustris]|uniref:response regulator n=1 Tax=Derxia lacustris TaxID=764842 RepID=UPI0015943F3B|nr:response regulator [Derxia lacustris]
MSLSPAALPLVLLVDDDNAVREITALTLLELGYAVLEASGGRAALDLLDRRPDIALLLVDYAMPGMNGMEVVREAARRRPGLPSVFITGYAAPGALAGVDETRIVPKPFSEDDLAGKLALALGNSPAQPAPRAPLPTTLAALAPAAAAPASAAATAAGLDILYVEDNELIRSTVVEYLESFEHRVLALGSAEAALEWLQPGRFDVLFTDISLPGMSGVELAREAARRAPAMQVVLASGYDWRLDLKQVGLDVISLPKPFDLERLDALLADIARARDA